MLKLVFYVPESHLEHVKTALFSVGAGKIGHYDSCCWQVQGQGQFRPLEGSQPFLGKQDEVETVSEYKVEMVLKESLVKVVQTALLEAHPYETPAYDFYEILDVN
ncbi:NGG1p interacting factor 3 protein, NIF3 [Hydrogenovibrio kuenenii]|uniref:NGG1p interacting factor 3 protein, NIF3 n=1 Tax=Hydrogenovibrio kuenenii TaxID=63658 RepID=UPI0004654690|nr:NGG1p interacting factor 3 protein, NIF3 [Hydrogenovibrio kuenenii]